MDSIFVQTKDHHRIAAIHHKNGHRKIVVLAHGFFNNKDVYLFQEITKEFSKHYDVMVFDFRGHGKSSGLFSWTSRESADLKAVLDYVKQFKYDSIGLIGFSLGAALSLIEAARNQDIKTVISVSAPYDFWKINYHFWKSGMLEDLKLNLGHKGQGKGVRPGNPWEAKIRPIDIVDQISPRSVLFMHGIDDWLINVKHSQELYKKAKEPKRITIIEKGGHAEKIFDDNPKVFMQVCLDWLRDNL